MIDVGTLGGTPVLVNINKMLIELNDSKLTSKVTSVWHQVRIDIKKLKQYVQQQDCVFYVRLLNMLRDQHLEVVDNKKDALPTVLYTHLRCAIVGEFREAQREVADTMKENIRRRQRGQRPL